MPELGEAYVSVRASTKQFPGDVKKGLEQASKDAETLLDDIGKVWGDEVSDATAKEIKKSGKKLGTAIESAAKDLPVKLRPRVSYYNVRDNQGRFAKSIGDDIENEVEKAFKRIADPGGPLSELGEAFRDAIGAGFNISGQSPLVGFLLPVVGAVIGLVIGAIQAISSLVAVLTTLPAVIAGIGVQVGVLFLAFKGLGGAISGAFAAKNAKELKEALKGLTPEAQAFVKSLLPLKPIFEQIQKATQSSFFKALGDPIQYLKGLGPDFVKGFSLVASRLGAFFNDFAKFLGSPTFVAFVRDIFPATAKWISNFGPAFIKILGSLIGMADQALPFLSRLGLLLSNNLGMISRIIDDHIRDGSFKKWLYQMFHTFELLTGVLFSTIGFIAQLMDTVNKAGGDEILAAISKDLLLLTAVFATKSGQDAIYALIEASIICIHALTGLVVAFVSVVAFLTETWNVFKAFSVWLHDDLPRLIGEAVLAAVDWFIHLAQKVQDAFHALIDFGNGVFQTFRGNIEGFFQTVAAKAIGAVEFVKGIPARIVAALAGIGTTLYNAGRSLLQGFIDGIRSMFSTLENVAHSAMNLVGRFVPGSPAEEGPFSGHGYTKLRGQRMVQDFATGMGDGFMDLRKQVGSDMGALVSAIQPSNTSNSAITFGSGAVRVTFQGALPTNEQAHAVGTSVGAGMSAEISRRNTQLAVRSL